MVRRLPSGTKEEFKDASAMRRKANELRERARETEAEAVRLLEAGDGAGAAHLVFDAEGWDRSADEFDKIAADMPARKASRAGTEPPPGKPYVVRSMVFFYGHKILDTAEDPQPSLDEVRARTSRAMGLEPGSTPDLREQLRKGVKRRLEDKMRAEEPKP